jgi:PRTRC genetic system protein A
MPGYFWKLRDFLKAENRQPNNIIAGQDGRLYEIRDSLFGRLVLHRPLVPDFDVIQEGFEYRLPKIPGELLTTAISFFKAYCSQDAQNEVMVQIFYDRQTGQYEIDCPEQIVRWDSIEADCTQRFNDPRYVQVLQIHSHNAMPAFFSSKDNSDEQAYMLYAVVGGLLDEVPEMKLRVGARGQFLPLPLEYIFDKPDLAREGTYPVEWHQRVQIENSSESNQGGFEVVEEVFSIMLTSSNGQKKTAKVFIKESDCKWVAGWSSDESQEIWFEGVSWNGLLEAFRSGISKKLKEGYSPIPLEQANL